MNILTVDNITKSYGVRKIFDGASFFLQEGEKAGIIGINGTGKSTLLKIIAGLEETDDGTVIKANHCLVRYLPQNPEFAPEETVLEAVLRGNRVEENAGTIEADAKSMLTKLGVTEFDQPCGQLSGGQRKRLALVSVLLSPAEILLLDEPTNHLDNSMSDWLEEQLRSRKGAMIMVTHDRYFLDSVTDRILELDKGKIYSYDANYSGYLELKMQREEMAQASEKKRLNILRNELAWVQRGARARSTKQKARLQRFEELKNVKGPVTDGKVELTSAASRLGRTTVEIENVSKSYGDKVLIRDFTYLFGKDDRVGFIGPNGSGKTTLMKMILGEVAPDSGHIEIGQTVKLGYYAQEIDDTMMHPEQRVIDYIRDVAEYITTEDGQITAARMLERFLFSGEDQYGQLGKLSGGERRRLQLCKVLMGAPNVLILDEPTNDLDIATLQVLEDYLDTFPGIVIVVSHDRYFLDRVVRRIFALEDTLMVQYEGGYTDYANRKAAEGNTESTGAAAASQSKNADEETTSKNWKNGQKRKLKFTYQEQKDYESIEGEMAALEDKIATLEADFSKYASDFVRLNELTQEKEAAEQQLEEKMERWMYLEDLAARIERGEEN
ncbi:MAG: ABC-F family ATP-binding cassette domain-containing protein [Lachnospiraceae bacterium]|nr:ABC-F family ATP-binding cassette domain-containing protein [Lachnospiraceae bacterium]